MGESEPHSHRRTYTMLSWFGVIGVGASLSVASQYFEYWLRTNDPAEHPLVELFIEHPIEMLVEKPAVMASKPVLSVVLSGVLLANLCLRLWLFAVTGYYRQYWIGWRKPYGQTE